MIPDQQALYSQAVLTCVIVVGVFLLAIIIGTTGSIGVRTRRILTSGGTAIAFIALIALWFRGVACEVALEMVPAVGTDIHVESYADGPGFTYRDGVIHRELHAKVGDRVRIHRDWKMPLELVIPALGVWIDVPRFSEQVKYFQAGRSGSFTAYCTIHEKRVEIPVVIHEDAADLERWLSRRPAQVPRHVWGEQLWERRGCMACHPIRESDAQGPSLAETFDLFSLEEGQREFVGGESARVDEAYLRESIQRPRLRIVEKYREGNMPWTKLSDDDLDCLIELYTSDPGILEARRER